MQTRWDSIVWWEVRRIPYNLAIFAAGMVTVFAVVGIGNTLVRPGEDVIEPLLLLIGVAGFGVLANLFYTLGWISELLWSGGDTALTAAYRPRVFVLGLVGSIVVTLLPCVIMVLIWIVSHIR
jgi:hypothetical protein